MADLGVGERIIFKRIIQKDGVCWLDSNGSEYSNEPSGTVKGGKFLD